MRSLRIALVLLIAFGVACSGKDAPVNATAPQRGLPEFGAPDKAHSAPIRDNDPRIVAKINGDPITMGEINTTANTLLHNKGLSPTTPEGQKELLTIRPNVFNTILTTRLLKQGAEKLTIKVDPELIEKQIREVKDRYPSEEEFLQAIKKEGLTLEQYRQALMDENRVRSFTDQVMSKDLQEPTEQEIRDYYDLNVGKFKRQEMVRASLLVIEYPENPSEWEKTDAFSLINQLYFRVLEGQDFGELVREHSTGPNAENGGDIGYKPRSLIDDYLKNAPGYQLKVGSLTPVLETPRGYVLIYPTDIVPERDISLEQASEEIRKLLLEKQKAENLQRWLDRQMEKTDLEIVDPDLYGLVSAPE